MSKFNGVERIIAYQLDRFPKTKYWLKYIYYQLNYIIFNRNIKIVVGDDYKVKELSEYYKVNLKAPYFFGYYDISPWSSDESKFIINELNDHNTLNIYLISKATKELIGTSTAWNWQQGAMAQWFGNSEIIFNDFEDEILGARIIDEQSRKASFYPFPVQAVNPARRSYISINYNTLRDLRPEYGYSRVARNFVDLTLSNDGLWEIDCENSEINMLVSLTVLDGLLPIDEQNSKQKINHVTYSPDGDNIIFMHRWFPRSAGKKSRLYHFSLVSKKLTLLLDDSIVSHYTWLNNDEVVVWASQKPNGRQYYLISLKENKIDLLSEKLLGYSDGHPSSIKHSNKFVSDTYPDKARIQSLFVFDMQDDQIIKIAELFSPTKYYGNYRCDLHPRFSKSGEMISFDSTYDGSRKSYIIYKSREE